MFEHTQMQIGLTNLQHLKVKRVTIEVTGMPSNQILGIFIALKALLED